MKHRPHLGVNERGHLTMGGVDSVALADEFGTSLYVIDEQRIRQRYREFRDAFKALYPKTEVKYSYKANTSLAVCKILKQEGCGADVLSAGELSIALRVGVKPKDIIFTGNNKTDEELEQAVEAGVIINLDAVHEMERLIEICERRGVNAKVSFRINPAISPKTHPRLATGLRTSKFGIHEGGVLKAYKKARDSGVLNVKGIHMHIGSQITSSRPFEIATAKLLAVVHSLKAKLGIELDFVDLGGGLGIRYREGERCITPRDLAGAIVPIVERKSKEYGLKKPTLYFEPGRFIVGDAGIMLTRVSTIKKTPYKKFVGTDAGFHVLLRPVMYGAYHEAVVANKMRARAKETADIVGNICESGDVLAKDRRLPKVENGDVIAFLDAGAYGMIMASRYNSRPLPAEVLVRNGEYALVRERETLEDLLSKQRLPRWLEEIS